MYNYGRFFFTVMPLLTALSIKDWCQLFVFQCSYHWQEHSGFCFMKVACAFADLTLTIVEPETQHAKMAMNTPCH